VIKARADRAEAASRGEDVDATPPEGWIDVPDAAPDVAAPHPGGRPTECTPEFCELAYRLAQQGQTQLEIADAIGIHESTFYRWKADRKEFREALQLGRESADQRVEDSLYHRAVGYSFNAAKVVSDHGSPHIITYREHVPPDVGAAKFWLTNRKGADWKSDTATQQTQNTQVNLVVDKTQLARGIALKLKEAAEPKLIEEDKE